MASSVWPGGKLALTKEDLAALRRADEWIFFHNPGQRYEYDPRGFGYQPVGEIVAIKRDKKNDDWDKRQKTTIPVMSKITDYDGMYNKVEDPFVYGFCGWVQRAVQETIAHSLRIGDEIMLDWLANNNNGYLTKHGLVNDDLHLSVIRSTAAVNRFGVRRRPTFIVASSICEDNSARMIRRRG